MEQLFPLLLGCSLGFRSQESYFEKYFPSTDAFIVHTRAENEKIVIDQILMMRSPLSNLIFYSFWSNSLKTHSYKCYLLFPIFISQVLLGYAVALTLRSTGFHSRFTSCLLKAHRRSGGPSGVAVNTCTRLCQSSSSSQNKASIINVAGERV